MTHYNNKLQCISTHTLLPLPLFTDPQQKQLAAHTFYMHTQHIRHIRQRCVCCMCVCMRVSERVCMCVCVRARKRRIESACVRTRAHALMRVRRGVSTRFQHQSFTSKLTVHWPVVKKVGLCNGKEEEERKKNGANVEMFNLWQNNVEMFKMRQGHIAGKDGLWPSGWS